jgi:cell division protein FtsQ
MNTKQKIILGITIALFVTYLVMATGFVSRERQHIYCTVIKVTVCDSAINQFVTAQDVRQLIETDNNRIIGTPIDKINTREIEKKLNARSVVKNTEVFTSIDGVLHIRVYQRRPIVRVLTDNGSFYIDEKGYVFPFSPNYTSYVPVVTGNVSPSFKASEYKGDIPEKDKLIQQIFTFSRFLDNDDFWASQVLQVFVQNEHDVEIIPRVGNQLIKIGSLDGYEYKLFKLYKFYQEAMPNEGWDKYAKIDLRFSNQVVATRRNQES